MAKNLLHFCDTCYTFEMKNLIFFVEFFESVTKKCNIVTFLKKKCNSKKPSVYAGFRAFFSVLLRFYKNFTKTLLREKTIYKKF